MYRVGIDLGGTKIEGILLGPNGDLLEKTRVPTSAECGYNHIISSISDIYRRMIDCIAGAPCVLGVSTPGRPDPHSHLLQYSNISIMNGKPFALDLAAQTGSIPTIENDANCFALAEARFGAGKGHRVVVGIVIGTGCGGGIVYDGRLHAGLQHNAGEWGHVPLVPDGPQCQCGKSGCVEQYVSGSAISNHYAQLFGERLSAEAIAVLARTGDAKALHVMEWFLVNFGKAVAVMLTLLDPDVVVVGGGLSNIPEIYSSGRYWVRKNMIRQVLVTPIVRNQLGDAAGAFGAAMIAGTKGRAIEL